jgi:hypothetical protein
MQVHESEVSPGTIVPAAHGWFARYCAHGQPDRLLRVVAWRVRGWTAGGHLFSGSPIVAVGTGVMDAEPLTPYVGAALCDDNYNDVEYAGVVHEDDAKGAA